MAKYVLSTGKVTERVEHYVLDLFNILLHVYPNDVPNSSTGFDFYLGEVHKDEFPIKIQEKAERLVNSVRELVPVNLNIELTGVDIISYSKVRINVRIDEEIEESIDVEI